VLEFWIFAVLFAAGVAALVRSSGLGSLGRWLKVAEASRFERFWSRFDGRLVAGVWLAMFIAAWLAPFAAGINLWGSPGDHPIRGAILLGIQSIAAVLLVPLTAGLYLYRRAIPQIARDEADERERLVQGSVYRRTHLLMMVGLAVVGTVLATVPDAGRDLLWTLYYQNLSWIDVLLPAWVLLFMLPSVIYAWMEPRRDDDPDPPAVAAAR
jgi:uncharacterized membrane protein